MRYSAIRTLDISNGKGIGVSLFTQGCSHHCKGCFNQETWDFDGGYELTEEKQQEFISSINNPIIDFVSILGGEPFDQPKDLFKLLQNIRKVTTKPIYLWSGYTYEQIIQDKNKAQSLQFITYLIDGKFVEELKDLKLYLRGSSNQRIIDVQHSSRNNIVLLDKNS